MTVIFKESVMRIHIHVIVALVLLFAQDVRSAPIHDAVEAGDMARVKQILTQDPKQIQNTDYVTGCIVEGLTPLHVAARMNRVEIARYMLANGANVNGKDGFGRTALHEVKSRDMAALLISSGANFNAKDRSGHTPLYTSAIGRKKDVVKLLLQCKARVETIFDAVLADDRARVEAMLDADPSLLNHNERNGPTPLGFAVTAGNHEMMRMLISRGADVNARSEYDGDAPLHDAVMWDDVEAIKILLNSSADIQARNTCDETPLHYAAWQDESNAATLLISNGADPNAGDHNLLTPLHEAVRYGRTKVSRVLLDAGADVNARTEDGVTPLHYAVGENLEVVRLLVERGADVNAVSKAGLSPLTYSEFKGIADYLASKGAKPHNFYDYALLGDIGEIEKALNDDAEMVNRSNVWGKRTPIFHAIIGDSLLMVEFLISRGADVNVRDVNGITPLVLAKKLGRVEIAKVLIKAGA